VGEFGLEGLELVWVGAKRSGVEVRWAEKNSGQDRSGWRR